MTVIKPNSIAGIVSVTAQGDVINFYKSDGTLAGLEIGGARINATGVSTFVDVYVSGAVTATSFSGDGSGLTGVASTDNIITSTDATFNANVSIGGSLTVNGDFTRINTQVLDIADKTVGVASTSTKTAITQDGGGLVIYGPTDINFVYDRDKIAVGLNTNLSVTGVVTATSFSNADGSPVGGIATESASPNNTIVYLNLGSAQDHKLTISGITTVSVTGGTEGDSHTVRIVNSGIATVGFSTYFLFPSGATPSLPTADGAISLISFTVNRVGAAGTQLLAGASVNFS